MVGRLHALLVAALACVTVTGHAGAADKALLIGVGDYQLDGARLPGIALDIAAMRAALAQMGFDPSNVVVLEDERATLASIRLAMQRHLIRTAEPHGRVIVYFSGHGTQVSDLSGDEQDGVDEVLMPYDARSRTIRGRTTMENVLVDDEIERMLSAIPAEEIIVIVDACHSGTITRGDINELFSEDRRYVSKAFFYDDMPLPDNLYARSVDPAGYGYIGLSAAGDNELAIATESGSVFTSALTSVIAEASVNNETLTLAELAEETARLIGLEVEPSRLFHPQLSGETERAAAVVVVQP
jgi:hypothetical protein